MRRVVLMDLCRHGAGVRIVLDEPLKDVSAGHPYTAHAFSGLPGMAPETLQVVALNNGFATSLPDQLFSNAFAAAEIRYAAYGRLAPAEPDARSGALQALADAFLGAAPAPSCNAPFLPSIYTYFGQFIAHEVSKLSRSTDPVPGDPDTVAGMTNLNTASFDLDTVLFEASKYPGEIQKAAPLCSAFGRAALGNTAPGTTPDLSDLPRTDLGRPVVPDGRNDANPQLAQLHVAILKTYQALLETSPDAEAELTRLLHAITIHDYLPKVIDPCVYLDVMTGGRRLVHPQQDAKSYFLTPIEFAAAAQRFGHAMVRGAYRWSRAGLPSDPSLHNLMRHTYVGEGLAFDTGPGPNDAIRRLPSNWTLETSDMLRCPAAPEPNLAQLIGPALTDPLQHLPGIHVQDADPLSTVNLAERTLRRGQEVLLPSAQSLWAAVEPVCGRFLTPAEICGPVGGPFHAVLTMANPDGPRLVDRTPLWFYILREAEVLQGGRKLGPLGGRIVMETIHAAIEAAGSAPGGLAPAALVNLFT